MWHIAVCGQRLAFYGGWAQSHTCNKLLPAELEWRLMNLNSIFNVFDLTWFTASPFLNEQSLHVNLAIDRFNLKQASLWCAKHFYQLPENLTYVAFFRKIGIFTKQKFAVFWPPCKILTLTAQNKFVALKGLTYIHFCAKRRQPNRVCIYSNSRAFIAHCMSNRWKHAY